MGRVGQIKEVSDGHARNFLIPRHLALPATGALLAKVQKEEAEKLAKIAKENERLKSLKNKLDGKTMVIKAKAQGQNLFAGIHEKEIALALTEKFGAEISPQAVNLNKAIKTIGLHEVEIKLTEDIKPRIKINIEPV